MGFVREYAAQAPERSAVEAQTGLQVLEFGTGWCGHCIAAQPLLQKLLGGYEAIDYRKIEDGKGRPLGRSFRVTLWPTIILLRDGKELARAVRPQTREDLQDLLSVLDAA
ncbi:thioredoxin [Xanthomonas citri pv. fuscans]|uniref:Thioredoxin n=1 Tax=Xanthomonas citri pv. fuscans TaxID=366649 RepID=A0AB34QB30_XANCI|nr:MULTISPECIES: thioredoxin family protein [Xanthomonas]ATB56677.1 putative thioredoxin [Xanthomonas citri pv. fuscans]ATS65316.1 thioredoxin family protein [Xanthomonas citri pv. phaseoli var. fuscans]ATS67100.1 thioredoxin family protein [Xanthomonas citri pv. phaseoli var. fuscans]ATS73365.1 thioredoxin family protein [Xanthomonas citri pv. phaseoli var. fuscans]ATS76205.1 thioredoxin family protein [Xanthomonas citri pv. phaseoli var. fuscans]